MACVDRRVVVFGGQGSSSARPWCRRLHGGQPICARTRLAGWTAAALATLPSSSQSRVLSWSAGTSSHEHAGQCAQARNWSECTCAPLACCRALSAGPGPMLILYPNPQSCWGTCGRSRVPAPAVQLPRGPAWTCQGPGHVRAGTTRLQVSEALGWLQGGLQAWTLGWPPGAEHPCMVSERGRAAGLPSTRLMALHCCRDPAPQRQACLGCSLTSHLAQAVASKRSDY